MTPVVCLAANLAGYPQGGGHAWVYLNWALALREAGCHVLWMECVDELEMSERPAVVARLRALLAPFALADDLVIIDTQASDEPDTPDADALLDLAYLPSAVARRFPRSALVDLDPGLTQLWAAAGALDIEGRDVYATVGERIADGTARAPRDERKWLYVPPCVSLATWPQSPPAAAGAYTTVSHWWADGADFELDGLWVENSKRAGFAPLLGVAAASQVPLELSLGGLDDHAEEVRLLDRGWQVSDAARTAGTPDAFAGFVRGSRGEFSAAKPSYVAMDTGWLSDRTVCYLASGRPAIVQDTGGTLGREGRGLVCFSDADGALEAIARVERDYDAHCAAAHELAQRELDGRRTAERILERLL